MSCLDQLLTWTQEENTGISLPSLRVDGFSTEMMSKIKTVRRSGLTFAPKPEHSVKERN